MDTYYKGEDIDLYIELFEDMTMQQLIPLDNYNIGIAIYNSSCSYTIFAAIGDIKVNDALIPELADGRIRLLIPNDKIIDMECGTISIDILLVPKVAGSRKIQRCHIFNLEDSRAKHIQ